MAHPRARMRSRCCRSIRSRGRPQSRRRVADPLSTIGFAGATSTGRADCARRRDRPDEPQAAPPRQTAQDPVPHASAFTRAAASPNLIAIPAVRATVMSSDVLYCGYFGRRPTVRIEWFPRRGFTRCEVPQIDERRARRRTSGRPLFPPPDPTSTPIQFRSPPTVHARPDDGLEFTTRGPATKPRVDERSRDATQARFRSSSPDPSGVAQPKVMVSPSRPGREVVMRARSAPTPWRRRSHRPRARASPDGLRVLEVEEEQGKSLPRASVLSEAASVVHSPTAPATARAWVVAVRR